MLPRLLQAMCGAVADLCLHQLASRMFGRSAGNFAVSFMYDQVMIMCVERLG